MNSTCIKVCHNRSLPQHKVFADKAARGKTSVDWFFGFKLHLVVNDARRVVQYHIDSGEHR
ncbi:transposase [Microcoleus sp. N3A4]